MCAEDRIGAESERHHRRARRSGGAVERVVAWCFFVGSIAALGGQADAGQDDGTDIGACCMADISCIEVNEPTCQMLDGVFRGVGTPCFRPGGNPVTVEAALMLAIPDNTPTGVSHTLMIPTGGVVADVDVTLVVNHTWVGDLCVTLEHDGMAVALIQRPGTAGACHLGAPFGCASDNYQIVLDDAGMGGPIEMVCGPSAASMTPPSPPSYVPNAPLAAFAGRSMQGAWTINISDNAGSDLGALVLWGLHVTPGESACGGPCCLGNGDAVCGLDPQTCNANGGNFLPLEPCGGVAGPNQCNPNDSGACCFPSGDCSVILRPTCTSMGGAFQGVGSTCYFPYKCFACCLPNTSCLFDLVGDCTSAGGTNLGVSYPGATNGACCFPDECCRRMSLSDCTTAGGMYKGNNTSCTTCAPLCPSDVNKDGFVNVTDMIAVITAWGTSNPAADINDDGIVNVVDLIAVITAWGACPPCH